MENNITDIPQPIIPADAKWNTVGVSEKTKDPTVNTTTNSGDLKKGFF